MPARKIHTWIRPSAARADPSIRVEWDGASCGQLVYLYTEVNENFAGRPEEVFDTIARPDKADRQRITLATIDIGGGTTDLVITDYRLDRAGQYRQRRATCTSCPNSVFAMVSKWPATTSCWT